MKQKDEKKCCEKCWYAEHPVKGNGPWCADEDCHCHSKKSPCGICGEDKTFCSCGSDTLKD